MNAALPTRRARRDGVAEGWCGWGATTTPPAFAGTAPWEGGEATPWAMAIDAAAASANAAIARATAIDQALRGSTSMRPFISMCMAWQNQEQ